MNILKAILKTFSPKERFYLFAAIALLFTSSIARIALAIRENSDFVAVSGGIYREGLIGQPIAINPIISNNSIDQDISALIYSRLSQLLFDYTVEQDGRVYILKLKENLKWDDGQPLTSDDVIFTIKTAQDPETRSPFAKTWQGVVAERISELQVQLALPTSYVFFPKNLERLPIIPRHIFGAIPPANLKLSAYNLEPIGSGPYRFGGLAKRKDGFITQHHLVINENYHDAKPFIKDFYFKFYESKEEIFKALRMREISGFGGLNPLDALLNKNNGSKIAVSKIQMPRHYAVFFNPNINPILKNADVRYALTAAIDKEKIIKEVFGGEAQIIQSPLAKGINGEGGGEKIPYEPQEAQRRLEPSKNQNIELNLIVPKIDFLEQTAKIIKEGWLAVGVKSVNLITLDSDDLLENVIKTNNYETLLFGNVLENPKDLFPFWHSKERFYPGLNLSLYQNLKADSLLETIRQTENEEKQLTFLREAENLITEDKPAIFLFSLSYTYLHPKNLGGFYFNENADKFLITPSDRFREITKWYLARARIIK